MPIAAIRSSEVYEPSEVVSRAQHVLSAGRTRDQSLDFTKGVLVVFMVIYHWLNYFVDLQWDVYRYLRFLTPSFIFITGFIIARIYSLEQFRADAGITNRLLWRGGKILLLFTILNLLVSALLPHADAGAPSGIRGFAANAYEVYVTGNGRAIFDVLVPIGYFLISAPLVMLLGLRMRGAIPLVTALLLTMASVASLVGHSVANLELLALAMTGMLTGRIAPNRISQVEEKPWRLALAYVCYVVAISVWNVLFPLQVVGVCLTLLIIHVVPRMLPAKGFVLSWLVQLGQYSLFAYLTQVAVLQVLRRGFRSFDLHGLSLLIPFVAALAITCGAVVIVRFLRNRSTASDRIYRAIFA